MADGRRRLFVALWPDDGVADALFALSAGLQARAGGRRMRRDTLHLTLTFIGDVPEARLPELMTALAAVRGEAFALRVDQLAWWSHNQIVWAGVAVVPPQLAQLAAAVRAALTAAGFGFADHGDFVPHLTLMRKARPAGALPQPAPIDWAVPSFALVESTPSAAGAAYTRLAEWTLAG